MISHSIEFEQGVCCHSSGTCLEVGWNRQWLWSVVWARAATLNLGSPDGSSQEGADAAWSVGRWCLPSHCSCLPPDVRRSLPCCRPSAGGISQLWPRGPCDHILADKFVTVMMFGCDYERLGD